MHVSCPGCGEPHDLSDMQVGFDKPDAWFAVPPDERERRWTLTSETAVLDGARFFVRGVLEIPVSGEPHPYAWGVWARVGEAHALALRDGGADGAPEGVPGWLANQLPGYPQTLGLEVSVHPRGPDLRPAFVVTDAAHPLAAEQRGGVYVERVLEMVWPVVHRGETPRLGEPRFATLERDRWAVRDAAAAYRDRDGVYWLPEEEARRSLRPGQIAKLCFDLVASDEDGRPARHVERMWVGVDHRAGDGSVYSGTLDNVPHNGGLAEYGMRVWFTPDHVLDIQTAPDEPLASDRAPVRCDRHGPSFPAYVCRHLAAGPAEGVHARLGFHDAEDPGTPRPDAWCDECEAVREQEGDWTERAEAFADPVLVCGACYDYLDDHHRNA